MVIKIYGRRHWLWRAVDDVGEGLNFLVQSRRAPGPHAGSCASCARCRASRQSESRQAGTDHTRPPSGANGCRQRFKSPVRRNASSRSRPPSRTFSPSNATFFHAASSSSLGRVRSKSGNHVQRQPERVSIGNLAWLSDLMCQCQLAVCHTARRRSVKSWASTHSPTAKRYCGLSK